MDIRPVPEIRTVVVIGGSGRMGALFVRRSREAGIQARAVDRPLTDELLSEALSDADLVVLSVPAQAVAEVAAKAAAHMEGHQILADVTSVKVKPMARMLAAFDGPVVGTHPLFGPDGGANSIPGGKGRVAVCNGRDSAAALAVADWFRAMGFEVFEASAEDHDRAVARIQGLNFVTTVAYLAALADQPDILDFVTPSFTRRLEAARKMLTEDDRLFVTLFDSNPYGQEAVRLYRSMLNVAAGGDVELLAERAKWWWRSDDTDPS